MPCHTARARRSEVPITTKKKRLMMKIVIVDDDRAAADALAQKLSTFDETQLCGIALNGMDGLRLVNETRPDVLFLDIELPDISGIEFLERANILPQYKCRTVMYTAHDRFMLSAFRNKAFDYLMKPSTTPSCATSYAAYASRWLAYPMPTAPLLIISYRHKLTNCWLGRLQRA